MLIALIRTRAFYVALIGVITLLGMWRIDLQPYNPLKEKRVDSIQNWVAQQIESTQLAANEKTLAKALLIGYRDKEFKSLQKKYTRVGLSHLLAISGLHTGIVFSFIYFCCYPLKRKYRLVTSGIILWCFTLVVGSAPSVVRASFLLSLFIIGRLSHRPNSSLHYLFLTALINLMIKPSVLFELGFQMSYLAVLFILLFYPLIKLRLNAKNKLISGVGSMISLSLSAQLGVLPLSLYHFGYVPAHFLLGNLLLIPLMSIVVYIGLISLIILLLFHQAWPWNHLVEPMLKLMNKAVELLQFNSFEFTGLYISTSQVFILYGILICLFISINYNSIRFLKTSLLLIIGLQLQQGYLRYQKIKTKELFVLSLNYKSALSYIDNNRMIVYSDKSLTDYEIDQLKKRYRIRDLQFQNLGYNYKIDSTAVFILKHNIAVPPEFYADVLLLSNTPLIHLERVIHQTKPKLIIADRTNSDAYMELWNQTALKHNLPFVNLKQRGDYLIYSTN